MRITQNIIFSTYVNDLLRKQESVYDSNKQLSTGKRVNASSDDPVSASEILSSRSLYSGIEQYEKNIDSGLSYLSTAEKMLQDAKDVLTSIRELAVSSANGITDASARKNTATVVSNLYDRLISIGNTSFDDKYIFSGYKTSTASFTSAGAYQGDANKYQIKIGTSSSITIGINGGEVFKGTAGGVDIFQSVTDLITALNGNNTAGIQAAIGTLEASFNQISNAVADIGGKVARLNGTKDDFSNTKQELSTYISGLEDADVTKVVSDLKLNQAALESAMISSGKVLNLNIFNYL